MNKTNIIEHVVRHFHDRPIVFTTGYASRIAYGLRPYAQNHFYMVGSMGMASAIARGVASRLRSDNTFPVVIDGDGAMLMGINCLLLEQEVNGTAILHIVANDHAYASTGGQDVPVSAARICALASAAGYTYAVTAVDFDELEMALGHGEEQVRRGHSALIDCVVSPGPPPPARVDTPLPRLAEQFIAYCSQSPTAVGPYLSRVAQQH